MESIQSLTAFNNSRDYNYSWTGDSTTWAPWQPVGGNTTPLVTISPSPVEMEPFNDWFKDIEPIKEKEKKKKFLRLIRPIKE